MPVFAWACAASGAVYVETATDGAVTLRGTVALAARAYHVCFTPHAFCIDVQVFADCADAPPPPPLCADGRVDAPLTLACVTDLLQRHHAAEWACVPTGTRDAYARLPLGDSTLREAHTANGHHMQTAVLLHAQRTSPDALDVCGTRAWKRSVRAEGRVLGRLQYDGRALTFHGDVTIEYGMRALVYMQMLRA